MAKHKKRQDRPAQPVPAPAIQPGSGISRRGWKVIGAGVGVIAVGYVILSRTDPGGQNWASVLSPFLLLGGYATVAAGILWPEGAPRNDAQV